LKLIKTGEFKFCWIVDFPQYEYSEEDKKIDFSHNPFSMPQGGLDALKAADTPEKILALKAYQYDIVCNGYELASGGIRNHLPEAMVIAFGNAGYPADEVEKRFGGMYRAFQYGAPPHGGMAAGLERMVMLLTDRQAVRDVAIFPMNQQANDILMGAPAEATPKQLKELHIRLAATEKKA
jgi:aspartyl-tRNA synthetase